MSRRPALLMAGTILLMKKPDGGVVETHNGQSRARGGLYSTVQYSARAQ